MQEQQQQMIAAHDTIDAEQSTTEAANKRVGQLDDYNIMDEVTVYFANGKVTLDKKYKPQLLQLVEKAKTITAFTIQIEGYASSKGSVSLNQRLSEGRPTVSRNFCCSSGTSL